VSDAGLGRHGGTIPLAKETLYFITYFIYVRITHVGRKRPAVTLPFHQNDEQETIFLTVCTKAKKPILASPEIHQLLTLTWQKSRHWLIGDYLLMPDHLHLFCSPKSSRSLQSWISYWKSETVRHWPHPNQRPIWQRCFWDTKIRSDEHYNEKWSYVALNPIRAGLAKTPQEWPYQGRLNNLF
jgi:putative transposase